MRKSDLKCAIKFKCRYYAVSTMFGAIFRMSSSSDLQMMKMLLCILVKTQMANDLDDLSLKAVSLMKLCKIISHYKHNST